MFISILWIILSYLIGSIPFGYLISRYSRGIDIRLVGRKQIGATNVFNYVGKWQGILTGFLDVTKGWVIVFFAQQFGFSIWVQIFAGLATIVGHNWSIYLKFLGGRGVATTLGVALALNSIAFPYAVIVMIIVTLLWDGAPATIIFLLIYLFLNYYTGGIEYCIFAILAFPVLLLKRLTGIQEDFTTTESKISPILCRLLFDRFGGPRQFPRWRKN